MRNSHNFSSFFVHLLMMNYLYGELKLQIELMNQIQTGKNLDLTNKF